MSNHHPTTRQRPRGGQPVKFVHEGMPGVIDTHGFILWGGAGFHADSAGENLLRTIERALRARIIEMEPRP